MGRRLQQLGADKRSEDEMIEWKPVVGYEGLYEVSSVGGVRSLERFRRTIRGNQRWPGKTLSPFVDVNGYVYVSLSNGDKAKKTAVHRIVLEAFVGPSGPKQQACHNDGVRTNNSVDNLRWDSARANAADKAIHGTALLGERSPTSILTQDQVIEIRARPEGSIRLGREYGVASSTIRAVRLRQNWAHV